MNTSSRDERKYSFPLMQYRAKLKTTLRESEKYTVTCIPLADKFSSTLC